MSKIKLAIILAAGMGSRLGGLNNKEPKGFLEIYNNMSLIDLSLKNLLKHGIKNVIIGTGYQSKFYSCMQSKAINITCVKNDDYKTSGSFETLYKCRHLINEPFLLLESDILYDDKGIKALLDDKRDNVILASGPNNQGDEVFINKTKDNELIKMSKSEENKTDELVGISKVSISKFHEMCEAYDVFKKKKSKIDYEYIYNLVNNDIYINKINDLIWCEIDNESNLNYARSYIAKLLRYG